MKNRNHASPRGVTLMEVIFAIGIVLTGLVGLAALIPVAAENAKATMELDRSVNESTSAVATGVAKGLSDLDSLVIFDKPTPGSLGDPTIGYVPSRRAETIRWKLESQSSYDPPVGASAPTPRFVFGKLESPGYGHHPFGSGLTSGICIDPLGMPDQRLINFTPAAGDNAFEYSRFPYYGERYNPLAAPNETVTAGAAGSWPMSPRMWRATMAWDLQDDGVAPVFAHEVMPQISLARTFQGYGGVSVIPGSEEDQPGSVLLSRTAVGSNFVDASRDESSRYTWFMTLAPPFLGGSVFRQSIVIVDSRVPPVPQRAGDPTALDQSNHAVDDPKDNPSGERLTWIGQALGFTDGAGGEVLMYGSGSVSDDINVGQWVMLSRQPHSGMPLAPTGPAVHRWFQVLGVDDAEYGSVNSGFSEPNWTSSDLPVWRRWVTLAGSDWSFGFQPMNDLRDDTFCTIVQGAVNVFESDVVVQ